MTHTIFLPLLFISPMPFVIAGNDCCPATCEQQQQIGAEWYYKWWPTGPDCGISFTPMVRDAAQLKLVRDGVIDLSGHEVVLGFNEPNNVDEAAGANMTLSELVVAWRELESYAPGRLASPAMLMAWGKPGYDLIDFVDAYQGMYGQNPRMDIIALHFYDAHWLNDGVGEMRREWRYVVGELERRGYTEQPVWYTEVGYLHLSPLDAQAQRDARAFALSVRQFCAEQARCEVLSWFAATRGEYPVVPLMADGKMTMVGEVWPR